MTTPGIRIIKKVSIADTVNDEKNEEQVIQIVSNEPVQIFSSVSKDNGAVEDMDVTLSEPVVQLEIENPDINVANSIEPLSASRDRIEGNVGLLFSIEN